jgi:hypothetical protein
MSLLSTVGSIFTKALPLVSVGLGLLSTVKQYQGAKALEKQGEFNAGVFREEASAAWRSYEDRAMVMRDEQRRLNQEQLANYAKSGVTLEGTPMAVLSDMIYRQSLDKTALYNTAVAEDKRLKRQGAQEEWQAHVQSSAARNNALANFGSTLISSSGRVVYETPWTSTDDAKVKKSASKAAPVKRTTSTPRYTRAQANAVPGASGWRPITSPSR